MRSGGRGGEDVDVHLYRSMIGSLMYLTAFRPDIMFAICACARKSTTRGCQFLGKRLISWQCKKQTIVANSTTEAEYVAAANCCRQVLWVQNQMLDYGFNFMNTKIYIDNESTICIVKNLVFHSKTKHIDIRHHFIRDSYEKKQIQVIKIHTDHNVADLLTKAFDVSRLNLLLPVLVYAARHTLTAVRHKLMLSGITYYCWYMILPVLNSSGHLLRSKQSMRNDRYKPLLTSKRIGKNGKKSRRKQRKDSGLTEPVLDEAHVSTPSYDLPQSGEDSMQLSELMNLCTNLSEKVLNLEKAKTAQAKEIASLKKRFKQLEKRRKLKTPGLKRLRKIGSTSRVESSNNVSLGAQEDAPKQGRKITDLDADAEVTLVDETQEMNDDNLMFDTSVLEEQEKDVAEKEVSVVDPVTTAGKVVTTANVEVTTINASTTTIDELTLAQTLIEIKAAKPKAVTSAATTTTTTRPKARGVVVQKPSEFIRTSSSLQASQLPQDKYKGKGIMAEPKVPLKKKDQIAMDEEVAKNLEAQLQAELEEEERISRLKEEKANIALLES
ncbi:hypothetical protein Tco_0475782 [Tanacetum coccineum]